VKYSARHRQQTRDRLVQAAAAMLVTQGPKGATVSRIAAAAGVTPGAIYKHFSSAEALLMAGLAHGMDQWRRPDASGDSQARLWRLLAQHIQGDAACPLLMAATDMQGAGPAFRTTFERDMLELAESLAPNGDRSNPRHLDDTLARISLILGGALLARSVASPALSRRIAAACTRFGAPETTTLATRGIAHRRAEVLGTHIHYLEMGAGPPMVLLSGPLISPATWRNVARPLSARFRCLIPDSIGLGQSGPSVSGNHGYFAQLQHLQAWLDAVAPEGGVTIVGHEFGATLAAGLATQNPRVTAIVMLGIMLARAPMSMFPRAIINFHQALRAGASGAEVLEESLGLERLIRKGALQPLGPEALQEYRRWLGPAGPRRKPILDYALDLPIDGKPADVVSHLNQVELTLKTSDTRKLLVRGKPGWRRHDPDLDRIRAWRNLTEVSVAGVYLLTEDSAPQIARAIEDFTEAAALQPKLARSS
jgi:haloalkane dehalogenase